ncbi:hypothetical protein HYV64_05420 [Candidatus Shapirobacteria bacterium]|nr:hypothetical protein [Candidatus Shapirobacteria bacterium]
MLQKLRTKIPTNKEEFVDLLNQTEAALKNLTERKLPQAIPGLSARLPTPTQPITNKLSPTTDKQEKSPGK